MIESSALSNLDVQSRISVAVARKTLDAQQREGEAAVSLIRSAAESSPARQGAISASPTAGETGRNLDVTA